MPNILSLPVGTSQNGLQIDVLLPSGIQLGERVYVAIVQRNNGAVTVPAGWTELADVSSTNLRRGIYVRVADGTESSATVSFVGTKSARWSAIALRTDAEGEDGVQIGINGSSVNTIDHPQLTTTESNTLVLNILFATSFDGTVEDADSFNVPGTPVEEEFFATTNSSYVGIGTFVQASPGLTPLQTSTTTPLVNLSGATLALYGASTPAILSINGGDDIVEGQSGVSVTHQNMGAITAVTLKATDGASDNYTQALSFSNVNGTTTTFDMPDISAISSVTAGLPLTSGVFSLSIELTDGTATVEAAVVVAPRADWAVTTISSPVTDVGYFIYSVTGAQDGEQIYYNSATYNTSINAQSGITTDAEYGDTISGLIFDRDTGEWKPHSIVYEAVATVPDIASVSGLNIDGTVTVTTAEPYGTLTSLTIGGIVATDLNPTDVDEFTATVPGNVQSGTTVNLVYNGTSEPFPALVQPPVGTVQVTLTSSEPGTDLETQIPAVSVSDNIFYSTTATRFDEDGTATFAITAEGNFVLSGAVDGGDYGVLIGYQDADSGYDYTEPAEFTINYTAPEVPAARFANIQITINLKLGIAL